MVLLFSRLPAPFDISSIHLRWRGALSLSSAAFFAKPRLSRPFHSAISGLYLFANLETRGGILWPVIYLAFRPFPYLFKRSTALGKRKAGLETRLTCIKGRGNEENILAERRREIERNKGCLFARWKKQARRGGIRSCGSHFPSEEADEVEEKTDKIVFLGPRFSC